MCDFAGIPDRLCDKFGTFGDVISALLPSVFAIAAMLAVLFLIWGGIRYMLSRGDPKALDAAKGTITYAIVGLLIILFSATIFFIIASAFKIGVFGSLFRVPSAYAAGDVDIGCTLKLGNQCISAAFPTVGSFFTRIIQLALFAAGLIFLAMTAWGGFRYLNAGGDPKAADSARQTITNAGIGLLIVVAALVIIEIVTGMAKIDGVF